MTRGELNALEEIARCEHHRDYFNSFPHKRRVAQRLMWNGYIELCGVRAEFITVTIAGEAALSQQSSGGRLARV